MKKFLIIALLITLILSSTGCIDTYLGKEMLGERVEKEEHRVVEKAKMGYAFETVPPDSENTKYSDSSDFSIKKETSYIHVKVEYDQSGWNPVLYSTYRHLTVTVFSPDGSEYENRTYEDTHEDIIAIGGPASGTWRIEVEAEGVGHPDYGQDSFTVTVNAKEPI
ncbi:MAG: hypothetical protein KJ886_04865 [Candidatus Thermoplasmatota archaeon]|nr:hypothetical protein [Candidatus Thermoplasmatota archaeon]